MTKPAPFSPERRAMSDADEMRAFDEAFYEATGLTLGGNHLGKVRAFVAAREAASAEAMREACAAVLETTTERVEWFDSTTNGVPLEVKGERNFVRMGEVHRFIRNEAARIRALPAPPRLGPRACAHGSREARDGAGGQVARRLRGDVPTSGGSRHLHGGQHARSRRA